MKGNFSFPAVRTSLAASPCVLNAANEVVVAAYLNDQIGFLEMSNVIEQVMSRMAFISQPTYEDYVACDREARILTTEFLR